MATKIVTKNSSTASAVPTASDLVQGELAVNVADKRLFTEDNGGSIVELGTNPSSLTVSGNIDVDGTTNLDVVDIDGAVDMASTLAVGTTIATGSGGASGKIAIAGNTATSEATHITFTNGAGAKVFAVGGGQSGVTNNGFVIRNVTDNTFPLVISDAGAATFTTEITANGGIALGDNDKATFGAGDDLEIYHDGSDSYIKDEGTGNLYLTTNGSTMNLQAGSDNMVKIYKDAQVEIFHDASKKLATTSTGIDVTGTATMDGLTVNAGTNKVVLANNFATTGNTDSPKLAFYSFGDVATYPVSGPSIKKVNTGSYGAGDLVIYQHGPTDFTNEVEALRIDSSGNLLVGTSSVSAGLSSGKFVVGFAGNIANGIKVYDSYASAATNNAVVFIRGSSEVGSITTTTSATAYNTSSDQRLKENIADADDAGSKIDAIQVRKYDWKADGSHQDYGMIAQELQTVAPEAVSGDADSEEMMGVDYSKLVPMLIKEIQSLRNRVAQLEE